MPEKYIPVGSFDTIRISVEYGPTVFADLVISTNPEHGYIIRREHMKTGELVEVCRVPAQLDDEFEDEE